MLFIIRPFKRQHSRFITASAGRMQGAKWIQTSDVISIIQQMILGPVAIVVSVVKEKKDDF